MRNVIVKIFIWLAVIAVLLAGSIVAGTILLKDKLIQYGVQAINNELNAPIQVDGLNFSLINSFPYASIVLDNVTVMSPKNGFSHNGFNHTSADTLLAVRRLALSFNIRKLLDDQLELNSVKVSDGQIFILIDEKGNDNFHIFKTKKEKTEKSGMAVMLEHLGFSDCVVQVSNLYKGNGIEWYMPDFEAEGKLNSGQFEVSTKGSVKLQWIEANKVEIVPLAPTNIKMDLSLKNDTLLINEGQLSSKGLNFGITGNVLMKDDMFVDLQILGKRIEVANALRYFTLATKEKPVVQSTGLVDFNATVKGKFNKKSTPLIVANFGLDNATVKYPKLDLAFSKVGLKGVFNNGGATRSTKSFLNISELNLQTAQSTLSGNLRIDNFTKPNINTTLQVSGQIDEWNRFIFGNRNGHLTGTVSGDVSAHGPLNIGKPFNINAFLKLNPLCQVQVENGSYTNGDAISLSGVSGLAVLKGYSLTLTAVNGYLRDIPVTFNGSLPNLLKAVAEPYPTMRIEGFLVSKNIDYKQIAPLFGGGKSDSKITYNVDLRMSLDGFSYNKFNAGNVKGRLCYSGDIVTFDGLNFSALDGKFSTMVVYRMGNNRKVSCKGTITGIDINRLFSTFDNFNQSYITDANIEGRLSSTFAVMLPFAGDTIDRQNIDFDGHLDIANGKLHGLEATNSIADFTKIDEFRSLEFSTLSNDMRISEGAIDIPKMDVECNACDISLAGTHKFTGDYEYHLTLILSDFMRGKAKRLQQTTPFGIVEDDSGEHTTLYLVATRNNGKSKIKFDKVEMKQQFREEMKQQKQEVKQILKREFGLFKNDTTVKTEKQPEKNSSAGFVIEWDEE